MQETRKIYELVVNVEPMKPIAHYDRYTPEVSFTVPEGNHFILGDNRRESVFSHFWPLNRIGI